MKNEAERQEQERKDHAEEYARKCALAREEQMAMMAAAKARREAQMAEEKRAVAEQQKAMDNAEAGNKAAVQGRMDKLEERARTFGAAVKERDDKEAAELAARIKRVQEEGERMSKEDAERRRNEHDRKVKDMMTVRAKQVKEYHAQGVLDKEAGRKQAIIFQEQLDEGKAMDAAKAEKRRKAREDQDAHLIGQMTRQIEVHPLQFGMTDYTRTQEVSMNREIFEQMAYEGFNKDLVGSLMRFKNDKGTSGKLDPLPSIGPSDAVIHPLELHAPDV